MSFTSNEEGDDEQALLDIINGAGAKKEEPAKKDKKNKGPIEVNFVADQEDLKNFNTKTKKIINDEEGEDKLNMKKLFVTEDDNEVYEQFEQEKANEIEGDLRDKIPQNEVKRGWNEWAGSGAGINEDVHKKKLERAEKIRKERIDEMKKKRSDNKMRGVVLNTEDRDKKFALKYLVKELPHPYNSVDQYKKVMDVAIGKEWTTLQSHKRLIQPDVLTKVGEIIKPLRYKKDVTPQTMDALV